MVIRNFLQKKSSNLSRGIKVEVDVMGWADQYVRKLMDGESVSFRPKGSSMDPLIKSGDLVFIQPIDNVNELKIGDIVLCKVNGRQYLHIIKAMRGKRAQIGNNKGHINGWVAKKSIYGRYVTRESRLKEMRVYLNKEEGISNATAKASYKLAESIDLPIPDCCPGSQGDVGLIWEKDDHHLSADIIPHNIGHVIEWFYRNRKTEVIWSQDDSSLRPSNKEILEKIALLK